MNTVRYVTVLGSVLTHAQLAVDQERGRTVCGLAVAGQGPEEPKPVERCGSCWADWRVRGEPARYVGARFGSPGLDRW